MHRPVLTRLPWKVRMTFSSTPGKELGAVKSTSWKDVLKTRCWNTHVTDGKPLVTVPIARVLRGLLRKGITSWRTKQSYERPEGLTLRTVHCISLSSIWDCKEQISLEYVPGKEKGKWSPLAVSDSFDPMDCRLPGSSVHGIFQARVLEQVAISSSRRSSQPRDWTRVSCIVGRHFTIWATREVQISRGFLEECSNIVLY